MGTRSTRRGICSSRRFATHALALWAALVVVALAPHARARDGMVVIQFDDGRRNHYTTAFPILQEHGLRGTFGVVTGNLDRSPYALTREMLVEMARSGHQIHDHTINHDAAFWGDTLNASLWGDSIRASLRILRNLGIATRTWNQPGGPGQGFSKALRDTLANYYLFAAGRVGLDWRRTRNLHWNLVDDPMSLGRGGVYSWGYNTLAREAEREGWMPSDEQDLDRWWQRINGNPPSATDMCSPVCAAAELREMIRRICDGYVQGLTMVPVFHNIVDSDSSAWALDSLCAFLVEAGLDVQTLSYAVARNMITAPYFGEQMPNPDFSIDRNRDGMPDGWIGATTGGWMRSGAQTTVYGPERGRTILRMRLRARASDSIQLIRATTRIIGTGPWHTGNDYVETVTTDPFIVPDEWITWSDTFDVDERVDRVRIEFLGIRDSIQVDSLSFRHVPRVGVGVVTHVPTRVRLSAAPNPFDASTTLRVTRVDGTAGPGQAPDAAVRSDVILDVFDVAGRRVLHRTMAAGRRREVTIRLDGSHLPSGVYFARVRRGSRAAGTIRLVHLR